MSRSRTMRRSSGRTTGAATSDQALIAAMQAAELPLFLAGRSAMIIAGTKVGMALRPSAGQPAIVSLAAAIADAILAPHGVGVGDVAGIAGHYVAHPGQGVAVTTKAASGLATGWLKDLLPVLKIAAGGAGLIVSGIALVYVAGRNTPVGRAAVGAVPVAGKVVNTLNKAAPERAQARSYAKAERASQRSERARSRVETSGRRVRVTSRKSGAAARAAGAEYAAGKGTRDRERLAALRASRRRSSPPIHSKDRVGA